MRASSDPTILEEAAVAAPIRRQLSHLCKVCIGMVLNILPNSPLV
jgi:hypothetical protein